jgi:RNA polymerase sigma-70 factor (ECF subfamily)
MTANPKSPPADDTALAREASVNTEAFAELYRRYLAPVYRYHLVHTASVPDAEDLTSQTFMAALEGLHSFRGDGSFAAWLMGIASHKRLLYFRSRRPLLPLDDLYSLPDPSLPTDQAALRSLQLRSVAHALAQINPGRAEAIILTAFAGLTYREAARLLHKTEAAVKMLVSRGLHELRSRTSLSLEVES